MSLRNLVHWRAVAVVALAGLAALIWRCDAQFRRLRPNLVYVGAVAILIVFAVWPDAQRCNTRNPDILCARLALRHCRFRRRLAPHSGWAALNSKGLPPETLQTPEAKL